ncbi:hypothetical protein L2E82_03964 [Cichorium intybus]|uniref:Uncharacterized protein n=1 Tax=Cichorium intybus TaxID=13427 RepID=A0ACB9H6B1_CICIN|nr:hypothetical protein L2E82_03964 [Cichorium intybus]
MMGVLGESSVEPAPITQDAGGPSNLISEPDLEDPIMQFVVHNFDRMNAMYKAFTRKLKELHQPAPTSANLPIIESLISDSDDVRPGKTKENAFVENNNNDPSNNRAAVEATPLTNTIKKRSETNNDFYYEPFGLH